jgi:hypothetical protein
MTRQRALENTHKPHPEGGEYIGADCGIWFGIQCISGCCGPALQVCSVQSNSVLYPFLRLLSHFPAFLLSFISPSGNYALGLGVALRS